MGTPSFSGRGGGGQNRARGHHLTATNMLSAFSGGGGGVAVCFRLIQPVGGGGGGAADIIAHGNVPTLSILLCMLSFCLYHPKTCVYFYNSYSVWFF